MMVGCVVEDLVDVEYSRVRKEGETAARLADQHLCRGIWHCVMLGHPPMTFSCTQTNRISRNKPFGAGGLAVICFPSGLFAALGYSGRDRLREQSSRPCFLSLT
jgi:hypothetical protein